MAYMTVQERSCIAWRRWTFKARCLIGRVYVSTDPTQPGGEWHECERARRILSATVTKGFRLKCDACSRN